MHTFSTPMLLLFTVCVAIIPMVLMWAFLAHKRSKEKIKSVGADIHEDDRIIVWQTVYQQTSESLRDQAKLLASSNFAGLAGGVALYTSSKERPIDDGQLTYSLVCFGLGLIFALLPISGIAEKTRDDLADMMNSLTTAKPSKVTIHHPWPTGLRSMSSFFPMLLLTSGIFLLISAITPSEWLRF